MYTSTILLFVIVILVIFLFSDPRKNMKGINIKNTKKTFSSNKNKNNNSNRTIKEMVDDVINYENSSNEIVIKKNILNNNFLNIQFHNDYRDVIAAINNLIPDKKQLFNIANIPLKYSEPDVKEVKNIVIDFIKVLNENLKIEIPNYRNPNSGWDEPISDPTISSGWDMIQESLGLAPSLYEKPARKSFVKLIAITHLQKYETEDEIKYSPEIVIQKNNVEDQMILKVSFIQDKRPLNDENNFFTKKNIEMKIIIEDIFIVGYLSKYCNDFNLATDELEKEKYFDFNQMEHNLLLDPKIIQKVLLENYKQKSEEINNRNALLDDEGQDFHKDLPKIYEYYNIKGTQTIFDDMNGKKFFI